MKIIYLLLISLILTVSHGAELEKSRLKSDSSFLDVKSGTVIYKDNVTYQHGNMTIKAETLTKIGENNGTLTATGNPVTIHYQDQNGETTDISAPMIQYHQLSGNLSANGNIIIVQKADREQLTLKGNHLTANQQITNGFSFILKGQPTEFELQQPKQEMIIATANQLRSNGKDKKTQLVGNVMLQQGTSSMAAAILTYDGTSKIISADKSDNDQQRVETEFFWRQENHDSKKPANTTQEDQ